MNDPRADLAGAVRRAFEDAAHPGATDITAPDCCDECDAVASFFAHRSWAELAQELESEPVLAGPPPYLTPRAFDYFLPAYLLAALSSADDAEEGRLAACVEALVPAADDEEDFADRVVARFSSAQRRVVARYLDLAATTVDSGLRRAAIRHAASALWRLAAPLAPLAFEAEEAVAAGGGR